MFEFKTERRLRRLFRAEGRVRPEHERELLPELMSRYDRISPANERRRKKMSHVFLRRVAVIGAAAVIVGAISCVAPAELDVDVGTSVEVRYDASALSLEPSAVAEAIKAAAGMKDDGEAAPPEGERRRNEVDLRVLRRGNAVEVRAEIWGMSLPEGSLAAEIQKSLPALEGAEIKEEHLQGKVRGTLGEKLGRDLFNIDVLDESDVETARQQVMEQLAAQGVEGKVDVQIEGDGKKRKVKVRVEREDCEPDDPGAAAAPEQHQ
jgi:hypothetical protein